MSENPYDVDKEQLNRIGFEIYHMISWLGHLNKIMKLTKFKEISFASMYLQILLKEIQLSLGAALSSAIFSSALYSQKD